MSSDKPKCANCSSDLESEFAKKFCSRSCSASYNNRTRTKSDEVKAKIRESVLKSQRTKNPPCTRIKFCKCALCGTSYVVKYSSMRTLCSDKCRSSSARLKSSRWLSNPENRKKYGRGKQSYMEQSFSSWLDMIGVEYETEVLFKNTHVNKCYFADFVFRDKRLIIELDGSQHLKTKEADAARDEYIMINYNFNIIRISHKEYSAKTRLLELIDLLK